MIFISGIISIIIQKDTFSKNKIRRIYFCPNCVNFLRENIHFCFFCFCFFLGGGGQLDPLPPPNPCAYDDNKSKMPVKLISTNVLPSPRQGSIMIIIIIENGSNKCYRVFHV